MTAFEAVLDQALKLPDEERSKLAASLLRSLEPEGDELSTDEWDRVWSAELEKRLREVREGTTELLDGDDVLAELRDISARP
jgi:hypothetical protein